MLLDPEIANGLAPFLSKAVEAQVSSFLRQPSLYKREMRDTEVAVIRLFVSRAVAQQSNVLPKKSKVNCYIPSVYFFALLLGEILIPCLTHLSALFSDFRTRTMLKSRRLLSNIWDVAECSNSSSTLVKDIVFTCAWDVMDGPINLQNFYGINPYIWNSLDYRWREFAIYF